MRVDDPLRRFAQVGFDVLPPRQVEQRGPALADDGDVLSGFILADADTVVLKESSGEQRQIPKSKIKKRVKQPMSVMPDYVGLGLTAQELADVAEFLLKAPTSAAAL